MVECPVLEDLYREKALVSVNKASVTIYWLAEEEHKIASMALADSLGLGLSHADRKLCRYKTQGKPWGFFKTHCSEHLLQSSAKASGDTVYTEVMRSVSSFFLPISHSPCVCALQAQSCPGEGEGEGRLMLL